MSAHAQILELKSRVEASIIGQESVIDRLLIGLLVNGNLLLEGLPGLAKTRAIKTLARHLDADFRRIQFTPDLLPSDVTGTEIYAQTQSGSEFRFEPGPIFANLILGDEINRAPAKVQAALLEAMEERQVTVAGKTYPMPSLFMVMATQNPLEQEGTYPLPEAQMDRFLLQIKIDYTSVEDEVRIIEMVRGEENGEQANPQQADKPGESQKIPQRAVFTARQQIGEIHVSAAIVRYIADLMFATRRPDSISPELSRWIKVGCSPRGSLALDKCARAHAWLRGRDYVDPEDVRAMLHDVCRHRIVLTYEAQGEGIEPDQVIDSIVRQVGVA